MRCEPDIESRLIEEHGQDGSAWQVTTGPLTDSDFARLPETHWTMLVQDVDKHLPELQGILDVFNFIPDWRRDDLMISYATEFGSVGPHTDAYDVFLLQAMRGVAIFAKACLFCRNRSASRRCRQNKRHSDTPSSHLRECYEASTEFTILPALAFALHGWLRR
jgi:hypothetical protein